MRQTAEAASWEQQRADHSEALQAFLLLLLSLAAPEALVEVANRVLQLEGAALHHSSELPMAQRVVAGCCYPLPR